MTTLFITLNMFVAQKPRDRQNTSYSPPAPSFLDWKVGYVVHPKGNGNALYTIKDYEGAANGDRMSYHVIVTLSRIGEEEETRVIRGSTLQSGYYYKSGADAPDPKEETKPITIRVDAVREFHPRKQGPGTRIILDGKTAYVVSDDYGHVRMLVENQSSAEIMQSGLGSGGDAGIGSQEDIPV